MIPISATITPEHLRQFQEEGYFILEKVIPETELELLRGECSRFIKDIDEEFTRQQVTDAQVKNKALLDACKEIANYKIPFSLEDVKLLRPDTTEQELKELEGSLISLPRGLYEVNNAVGISHPGKRYFITFKFLQSDVLKDFLFGETMQSICKETLGNDARLFLEQFVVKGPEVGMKFGWHQDSGYVPYEHDPYVTCWCALDDMSEKNGTIYVTPFSKDPASKKGVLPHKKEGGSNDMCCYNSDVPLTFGVPVVVPAGSIAVFSSLTPHSSGANSTSNFRRAYIVQYSAHPIEARFENAKGEKIKGPRHFDDLVLKQQ